MWSARFRHHTNRRRGTELFSICAHEPKEGTVDEQKLQEFLGRVLVDLGGAVNAVLMSIGDELGLYKALAKGPQSPAELARNTNTHERYIREWLNSQAAGGYVTFDKASGKYSLSPEPLRRSETMPIRVARPRAFRPRLWRELEAKDVRRKVGQPRR